jgi:Spy/CpxP family protein refolding chaperone
MTSTGERVRKTLVILSVVAMVPSAGHAFGPHGAAGKRMGPPQAAIDACKDLNKGDVVQFTTRRGDTVSGTCREVRGGLIAVPEGGFHGRHRGTGPGPRVARMSKALNLTEAQQEQVRTILTSERERNAPLRQQLVETRKKFREAVEAEPFEESTVRALAEEQSKTRVELAVSRARTKSQLFALLTPEQRELARKLGPWGKRRHGHRHGW